MAGKKRRRAGDWPRIAGQIKKAARKTFYDQKNGVIVSGPNRQVSYLSQVWMILSETLTAKEGAKAMATVLSMPDACYPGMSVRLSLCNGSLVEMWNAARGPFALNQLLGRHGE